MKKINTILAAVGALLMLTVTSAISVEIKAGVSANGMAAYANVKETLKDSGAITNEEAILATSFASGFIEVSSDAAMGIGIGISYAPEVADLEKETRAIQSCADHVSTSCTSYATGDSGNQIIDGKIEDLIGIYLTLPVGDTGAFVKAGYMQATLNTTENLATGSKYSNEELTGTHVGGGYEAELGDMAFWRAEGSMQMWDDVSASGSEAGATSGAKNKIDAELGSVTGTLSVGMKF